MLSNDGKVQSECLEKIREARMDGENLIAAPTIQFFEGFLNCH